MDELIDRFLKYIYRKNTQSDKTIESYKNDLNQIGRASCRERV